MKQDLNLSRRDFLQKLGIAGSGLVVGLPMNLHAADKSSLEKNRSSLTHFEPNAFLQILADNTVHFHMPRSEMGQGIFHGLTTLIAEELDILPEVIKVHHVGVDKAFVNPEFGAQVTGGSNSMRVHFLPIRQAAANAREMLRLAAAEKLNVDAGDLTFFESHIYHNGNAYAYGDFVEQATKFNIEGAPLKPKDEFKFLGKPRKRVDGIAKVTGTAEFGIDVSIPNMHYAAMMRSPVYGGTVESVETEKAKSIAGVKEVVKLKHGVAVVATSYWQARKAIGLLDVKWNLPELARYSTESMYQAFQEASAKEGGNKAEKIGEGASQLDVADKVIEAEYWTPYLAHATMEPMNCVASLTDTACDIWVGSQAPDMARNTAAFITGLPKKNVRIHSTYLGGGFGRRSYNDNIIEAVSIAKETGLPIKLVWSREDDMKNDYYRPASLVKLKAGVNQDGVIDSWFVKRTGPNIMPYTLDEMVDGMLPGFVPDGFADWISKRGYGFFSRWKTDSSSIEGTYEDYDMEHKEVRHVTFDPGVRLGYWRSVGSSWSAFCTESFIDELASNLQKDPVELRLEYTKNNPRLNRVIKDVAKHAAWESELPDGHFKGVAAHTSFKAAVAQIAEISISGKSITVHKVTCVIDCGFAVNPDIVKSQVESGIVYGLTAALYGEINFDKGAVKENNFYDYQILRMSEMPEIKVHIIDTEEPPVGVGEPGLPPIAPAVANAVFAATGKRLRSLPLRLS